MNDSASRYLRDLGRGRVFEDHVCRLLYQNGIPLQVYRSRDAQKFWGESTLGLEVKLDERFRETGNLFIETEERPGTSYDWQPAGVYSVPASWLYAIGDFHRLYIFATTTLQLMHRRPQRFRRVGHDTGRGFLLPLPTADKWAAHIIDVDAP